MIQFKFFSMWRHTDIRPLKPRTHSSNWTLILLFSKPRRSVSDYVIKFTSFPILKVHFIVSHCSRSKSFPAKQRSSRIIWKLLCVKFTIPNIQIPWKPRNSCWSNRARNIQSWRFAKLEYLFSYRGRKIIQWILFCRMKFYPPAVKVKNFSLRYEKRRRCAWIAWAT